jgi:hypothetical protein
MKKLYIIDYENAHWCGGQLYVVVWAQSPEHAETIASDWMEEQQRTLFEDEYGDVAEEEDGDYNNESAYIVNSVSLLDKDNEHWRFFHDPSQLEFYPTIE